MSPQQSDSVSKFKGNLVSSSVSSKYIEESYHFVHDRRYVDEVVLSSAACMDTTFAEVKCDAKGKK